MMNNIKWPLIGNENVVDFLSKSIENGKVAGSYIFLGNRDLGKSTIAKFFAKSLFCEARVKNQKTGHILPCGKCQSCKKMNQGNNGSFFDDFSSIHSDYFLLKKDDNKKDISVDQIREFIHQLSVSSFLNSYKVGIIKDADNLNIKASNAFLKTLEEPKDKVVIILIMQNIENVPKTILSRSQIINFKAVKMETIYDFLIKEYNVDKGVAMNIAHISMGSPALAVKFLQEKKYYNIHIEIANTFINFFYQTINENFLSVEKLLGTKVTGQELVDVSMNIISVWSGVLRDLFLLNIGSNNLIQNRELLKRMEVIRINNKLVLKIFNALNNGVIQLKGNVNPKLVLNNIILEI